MCKSMYIVKAYSIHHTLIKQKVRTNSFRQKKTVQKIPQQFLRFLYQLKHKVRLSKTVWRIFHFWFRFVLIKVYIFVQQSAWIL